MNRTERLQKRIEQEQAWRKEIKELRASLIKSESGAAGLRLALEKCRDTSIAMRDAVRGGNTNSILFYEAPERLRVAACEALSTPADKSMVARSVLELCRDALVWADKVIMTHLGESVKGASKIQFDKFLEAKKAANQELERSGG